MVQVTVRKPSSTNVVVTKPNIDRVQIATLEPEFIQGNTQGAPSKVVLSKPGLPGNDGAPGSKIYSGIGAPTLSIGIADDYYIDTQTRLLYGPKTTEWPTTAIPLGGSTVTDTFTVTPEILLNKYVTLSHLPNNVDNLELFVFGGINQQINSDFAMNGQILTWENLALEMLLDNNTTFVVKYTL